MVHLVQVNVRGNDALVLNGGYRGECAARVEDEGVRAGSAGGLEPRSANGAAL
jgi:hypothetical protein